MRTKLIDKLTDFENRHHCMPMRLRISRKDEKRLCILPKEEWGKLLSEKAFTEGARKTFPKIFGVPTQFGAKKTEFI